MYNWIKYDICACGNPEGCINKETCARYKVGKMPGIHTYSLFNSHEDKCEYYIEDKEGEENVKSKNK